MVETALACEPAVRSAFLAQACSGDELLLREVESLISSHEQSNSFIEAPASDVAAELLSRKHTLGEGQEIGRYRMMGLLGTGGMGEVYLAEDVRLGRTNSTQVAPGATYNVALEYRDWRIFNQ